ncbi:hypothetical protein HMPREF0262_02626 [Clostridium sp. ATCC 29733]|nr:hypothetical protein HMPREF0262_02626 [Clostridium sp. ATCC 29733]
MQIQTHFAVLSFFWPPGSSTPGSHSHILPSLPQNGGSGRPLSADCTEALFIPQTRSRFSVYYSTEGGGCHPAR